MECFPCWQYILRSIIDFLICISSSSCFRCVSKYPWLLWRIEILNIDVTKIIGNVWYCEKNSRWVWFRSKACTDTPAPMYFSKCIPPMSKFISLMSKCISLRPKCISLISKCISLMSKWISQNVFLKRSHSEFDSDLKPALAQPNQHHLCKLTHSFQSNPTIYIWGLLV